MAVIKVDLNNFADEVLKSEKPVLLDMNRNLPSFKQIRNIEIRKTEFEKTTTKKIKRQVNIDKKRAKKQAEEKTEE